MPHEPKTVCFAGHKELKISPHILHDKLYSLLEEMIGNGYRRFISGGARGFGTLAAEVVYELSKKYKDIELILILPCLKPYSHEFGWSANDIAKYETMLKYASKVICRQEKYYRGCCYIRDMDMVDLSDACICYQYKLSGETAFTAEYAAAQHLILIRI